MNSNIYERNMDHLFITLYYCQLLIYAKGGQVDGPEREMALEGVRAKKNYFIL